jgi:MFS family permease
MPKTVWALGITSLFMDVSSEMIHALLPVFLVGTLGASATLLGVLEGFAEATAQIVKIFSGWLSDRLGKRKLLAVLGYGMAAFTKPAFPLASTVELVIAARMTDRVGKGIRGAPRDALIADVTHPDIRGAAFGLRQALDTVGAAIGPAAAIGLMMVFHDDIRTVLWFAVVPAFLAVAVLALGVEDRGVEPVRSRAPIRLADARDFPRAYWAVVLAGVIYTLARFSEAFLVIRANAAGLPVTWTPAVIAAMSIVYAAVAYPAGRLQDRLGGRPLLVAGLVVLIAADLALGLADDLVGVFVGIALWGASMGLSQGVLSALVAATAPAALRGTGFGLFNLASGVAMIPASIVAGIVWDRIGPGATFLTGAGLALAAAAVVIALPTDRPARTIP